MLSRVLDLFQTVLTGKKKDILFIYLFILLYNIVLTLPYIDLNLS